MSVSNWRRTFGPGGPLPATWRRLVSDLFSVCAAEIQPAGRPQARRVRARALIRPVRPRKSLI
jgi:hypothetical protein